MSGINARTEYELNAGGEPVKNATYWKRQHDKLADRIAELEKDLALKTRDRDVFRDFTLAYEKRIGELEKLEQDFIRVIKQTNPNNPQTKPLSDEEVIKIRQAVKAKSTENWADTLAFARAIEERHGIK